MIGIYHRGYFNSGIAEGSITPAEYIGYQIASCYLQLQFDPITTGLLINTFSFELFGNTAAEIPTVTVTLGGVVEEVRIVPVGNKFTLEGLCATREKFDKVAELVAQRLTVDENGEFILRELTTEEFEEIEKALYKEGSRKVIATLEGD